MNWEQVKQTDDTAWTGPPDEGEPAPEPRVRRGADRRRRPTPRVSRFSLVGGRRRRVRRDYELEGSFVDQYSTRMWLLVLWVALMNTADSFFTIVHLQRGGIELNPVAGALLELGRAGFVLSKAVLIALPLVILCVHKNFSLARFGLWMAAATYTLLLIYHLTLF